MTSIGLKYVCIILLASVAVHSGFKTDNQPGEKTIEPPKGMVHVPSGPFIMGSNIGDPDCSPQHIAETNAFFIDKYEVSNAEYASFDPEYKYPEGAEERAAKVNWEQANAYAISIGKRLPTEKEWEKAARGTDGRMLPWGDFYDDSFVVYSKNNTRGQSIAKPASPYGCFDMAGSVWEWTADWYQQYPGNTHHMEQYGEKYKVIRGGSTFNNFACYTTFHRYYVHPTDTRAYPIGMRLVQDIEK